MTGEAGMRTLIDIVRSTELRGAKALITPARGSPPSESGGSGNALIYRAFRTSRTGGGEGGILTKNFDLAI
jgi:hypothetical protein